MEELIGKTLGQYEIREKIGEGGMAHVFKAYQPSLNRFMAVKVLPPPVAEKKGFTERFKREAYSIAHLHHPHILPVYDFGVQGNYNYIVMRYVERSRTLANLIEEEAPLEKLINYIIQVADALNYAHEQGIIHRDVKPSNILIDGRWALLSDFGLVKMSEATTQLTGTGVGMGTPAYMSPEQGEGIGVDHRTDIYALGVILYRILTGTIPHDAPTPIGILLKRKTEPVPSLRKIKPSISLSLEQVTLRALAMKPDDRYSSATLFAEALMKAQTDPNYREKFNGSGHSRGNLTMVDDITLPPTRVAAPRKYLGLVVGGVIAALVVVIGAVIFALYLLRGSNDSSVIQPTPQLKTTANADVPVAISETDTPVPPTVTPSNFSQATDAHDVPVAPASPTPTGTATLAPDTPTSTPTPTPNPPTPTATSILNPSTSTPNPLRSTATSTLAAATAPPIAPAAPTATAAPSVPTGQFTLLKPTLDDTSTGPTEFEWRWDGPVGADQGFEVRVWREGEPPAGAHNAVEDNKNGSVAAVGNNTFRMTIHIQDAAGVRGRGGEYLWTVVLVQISPEYKDLGIQAPPGHLRLGLGGGGGGGDGGGGSGGGPTF